MALKKNRVATDRQKGSQEEPRKENVMFRTYIVGRGENVARVMLNTEKNKYSTLMYEAVVSDSTRASTRINCLAGLVHTMRQLQEHKDKLKGVSVIYVVGMVSDAIQKGTFKYWLLDGKTSNGETLHETEIELWQQFAELYKDMYLNVVIRNISNAVLPRNSRFAITNEMRVDDKFSRMAWELVPEVGEGAVESDDPF